MKKLCVLILLISLSSVLSGCQSQEDLKEKEVSLVISSIGNTTEEKFRVVSATALDLLKDKHKVEVAGKSFIKCIDGICVNNEVQWTFYVNEEFMHSSADRYYPKEGDRIEFRYRAMEALK